MDGKSEFIEKFLDKHQPLMDGAYWGAKKSKFSDGTDKNEGIQNIINYCKNNNALYYIKEFSYEVKVYMFVQFVLNKKVKVNL